MSQYMDKSTWQSLPIMKYAVAIAGLFHDFGKATILFQDKLNPNVKTEKFEPFRHEWVSMRLFQAFVQGKTDEQWLNEFSNGEFDFDGCCQDDIDVENNPFTTLAPFAKLIAWLILTHHKLPKYPEIWEGDFTNNPKFENIENWLSEEFRAIWNSPKSVEVNQKSRVPDNWEIVDAGLPINSCQWEAKARLMASKALKVVGQMESKNWIIDEVFVSHISRMALMLADHYFSSFSYEKTRDLGLKSNHYPVYANTYKKTDGSIAYKQQLDEHLIGVADNAFRIVEMLPEFVKNAQGLQNKSLLEDKVGKDMHDKFGWQDNAKSNAQKLAKNTLKNGFFGINMASTGCGKTIANAKIMYAIGKETGKIRFNVALGLRTLTLQTGTEFKNSLDLDDDELAIAVGGIAVKALYENQQNSSTDKQNEEHQSGSASESELNPDFQLYYKGKIEKHALSEWTAIERKGRAEQLLLPPVLVCTIDHLIPATEGIKKGHQIAPMLRLLSSDLILDEPDDFGLEDLPALCRLVHWSAMLGSRVLLSTATMPPAFVYACFEAYQAGWAEYAKANIENWDNKIQCAWFDERSDSEEGVFDNFNDFQAKHKHFVNNRVKFLEKQTPKRIGKIVDVVEDKQNTVYENMAKTIYQSIHELHTNRHISKNNQYVSIGLVRMANIDPMIAVAKALMAMAAPKNMCIHYCVYHSQFPLAVRSHIEEKLDFILKRNDSERIWDIENGIGKIINDGNQHHIFVVLASPVAEVGRDHDYDWAVVEPSSMRSIIQLAGRVLRHRDICRGTANIHLLNKNIKGLKGEEICFKKPGFESKDYNFILEKVEQDMNGWLDESEYKTISSIVKIKLPGKYRTRKGKYINLSELEHAAITGQLFGAYREKDRENNEILRGNGSAKAWWKEKVSWCAEVQRRQQFRKPKYKEITLCRYLDSGDIEWREQCVYRNNKIEYEKPSSIKTEKCEKIILANNIKFWIDLDEENIYNGLMKSFKQDMSTISKRFGNVVVPIDRNKDSYKEKTYHYHNQFGIFKEVNNDE